MRVTVDHSTPLQLADEAQTVLDHAQPDYGWTDGHSDLTLEQLIAASQAQTLISIAASLAQIAETLYAIHER